MKYRMLQADELSALEADLKAFLIVNGIDGSIWEQINKDEPEKAVKLVEIFSDNVFQIVYEKMQYVEFRSEQSCIVFELGSEEMRLISLNRKSVGTCSLATPESIHEALTQHLDQLEIYQSKKNYTQERELEVHQLLSQGCVPSSKDFWVSLEKAFLE